MRTLDSLRNLMGEGQLSGEKRKTAQNYYINAIGFAARLDPEAIVQVVLEFDPVFGGIAVGETPQVRDALVVLETASIVTRKTFQAALRLCRLAGDRAAQQTFMQREGLLVARTGDANDLLATLFERHQEGSLSKDELQAILQAFLERRSFEGNAAWGHFFGSLPETLIPRLHQVFAVLGRHRQASAIAEEARDLRSALAYQMAVSGMEASLRALDLATRLADATATVAAHLKVAEHLWAEGKFSEAAFHFQEADRAERASDCQRRLGNLAGAIQARPKIQPEWLAEIRDEVDLTVRAHLAVTQYVEAACLLRSVEKALRARSAESTLQLEADRTDHLLAEVVNTCRAAFEAEVRTTQAQPGAGIFKRWSLLEEAAGNFLEAGLQAELAHDYFAASLLFEKAGAFGQALSALAHTAQGDEPKRRAELLEQGGDFFMAGLLYERLGEVDKAGTLFEGAGDFARAARLRRMQVGDIAAVFDERWLQLLLKAQLTDSLAELCLSQARTPGRPADERAGLLRRVKVLVEQGLVAPKWMVEVAAELPATEAANRTHFNQRAREWAAVAERAVRETYLDCFGMDLGTSNSAVALFNKKKGQVEVVEWRGRQTIPSVFAVDQSGREVVGISVSELMGTSPRAIVTRVKRAMGTDNQFKVDGKLLRAEEISARIIDHARTLAREHLCNRIAEKVSSLASQAMGSPPPGEWVTAHLVNHPPDFSLNQAVLTVPAYFNDAQKQATRTAATLANIGIKRLIHEPTAACLAQRLGDEKDELVLVVDLGAGTLDLSLLKIGGGVFEVEEIEGDNLLGGSDLDETLFEHFVEVVRKETGHETSRQGLAGRRLHQACEELKIELSSHTTWKVKLPHLIGTTTVELSLRRDELERLATPWLRRIQDACRKIKGRPARVLLIGGGALMPSVRRCVKEVFGVEPSAGAEPLTAVARGAVIQAAILAGEMKNILVLDAVPFSLGIKSRDSSGAFKFDPLIRKHSTIPTKVSRTYSTKDDNQPNVHIEVFQGEDPTPEINFKIGQFVLEGIPPAKAGVPQIEVTFDIDVNCLLSVTARDMTTHREREIKIADSHLLAPAQVASLQQRFRETRVHQERFDRLGKLAEAMAALVRQTNSGEVSRLQRGFEDLLRQYESYMTRYAPTRSDNETLLEIYRERTEWESKARLAVDRWGTLRKSAEAWLPRPAALDLRTDNIEQQLDELLNESESLLRRVREGSKAVEVVSATYRKWGNTLQGLAMNMEGSAEDLARHFLRLARHDEAAREFRRMGPTTTRSQVELGLEILARQRQRDEYMKFFNEHSVLLGVNRPDFVRLNHSVRTFASSIVWIQQQHGTGSGFAIAPNAVATNRHVVTNDSSGKLVAPNEVRVVTRNGIHRVTAIHVPELGGDDVAILTLAGEPLLPPLTLGFSELVEVGERIMTLGFPSPGNGGFEENLYCNAGLVNRIRSSDSCSERVLEVSVELQGGISGAPILNELGEVVGLVTFTQVRSRPHQSGHVHVERSFYAVPIEILRRLRSEISEQKTRRIQ